MVDKRTGPVYRRMKGSLLPSSGPGVFGDREISKDLLPDEDFTIDHPRTGESKTVETGVTRFSDSAKGFLRSFVVDVPADVGLELRVDGSLVFDSDGNESGERVMRDGARRVGRSLTTRFDNQSGSSKQVRVTYILSPSDPRKIPQSIRRTKGE